LLRICIAGSAMAVFQTNENMIKLANKAIIGGLFLQIFFFAFFMLIAAVFHTRMLRKPTPTSLRPENRWSTYLMTLYIVSVLILVRSVFRAIEYIQGNDGSIIRHEYFMYVFDALLMFLVMAYMNWKHPGEVGVLLKAQESDGFPFMCRGSKIEEC
jgi:hypothetical protein